MTPDPYAASGGPSDPGSWNRYAYTRGDPVNRTHRLGYKIAGVHLASISALILHRRLNQRVNFRALIRFLGGGDPQCMILYLAGQNNPDAEQMFETYCAGGGTGFAPDPGGGGDPPPAPRPECDRGNETNAKILDFIAANLDAANKLSALTAQLGGGVQIPAGYLLAWAGIESGSGVDPAPVSNGNYFGLTLPEAGSQADGLALYRAATVHGPAMPASILPTTSTQEAATPHSSVMETVIWIGFNKPLHNPAQRWRVSLTLLRRTRQGVTVQY